MILETVSVNHHTKFDVITNVKWFSTHLEDTSNVIFYCTWSS